MAKKTDATGADIGADDSPAPAGNAVAPEAAAPEVVAAPVPDPVPAPEAVPEVDPVPIPDVAPADAPEPETETEAPAAVISMAIAGVCNLTEPFPADTEVSIQASVTARIETGLYPVISPDEGVEIAPGEAMTITVAAGDRIGVIGAAVFSRAGLGVLTITF